MPEHSEVDMDDDIVQAYLHFKERDYTACLRILEDNISDKDNIALQHNQCIVRYLKDDSREYEKMFNELEELCNKIPLSSTERKNSSSTTKATISYNMAVLLSLQQKYEECEQFLQKMLSEYKNLDNSILLRCNLLLIELYLSLYRMKGETKEWLHQKCLSVFSQTESLLAKDTLPDYIKNRLHFRYHIYRSLYFLEQGSVKGVKKEVKSSTDYYLLFSNDCEEDYMDHIRETVKSSVFSANMSLDSFENATSIDGYLPPILKTRLEFRRGNSLKILGVLNQVYESDTEEDHSIIPNKDCFYYSMLSGVYFSGGMYYLSKYYINKSIECAIEERLDSVIVGSLLKNLSISCVLLNQLEEGLEAIKQAIKYLPLNPTFWFRYGEICYQLFMDLKEKNMKSINPFSFMRDNMMFIQDISSTIPPEAVHYLKEAMMAFTNVIEIYSQRNENTSSVLYASYLRKATILLDMNDYSQCIEICNTGLSSLSSISGYDDDDLSISKEVIEFVLSLYLSECQMYLTEYDNAFNTISPSLHPQFYPPVIVEVANDPSLLSKKEVEIEESLKEWSKPFLESFIYNLTLLSVYKKNWSEAELYSELLMFFKASLKNARLKLFLYLQMGERDKAKAFYNDYLSKCWILRCMSQYELIGKQENKERLASSLFFLDKSRRSLINCHAALYDEEVHIKSVSDNYPVSLCIFLKNNSVRLVDKVIKRKTGLSIIISKESKMGKQPNCLGHYDFYFSQEYDRKQWYCYLSRCVISDSIPKDVFDDEDPLFTNLFIPLPQFEDVSPVHHLSLLWHKLRLCCIHLPSSAYLKPTPEAAQQIESINDVCSYCQFDLNAFRYEKAIEDCFHAVSCILFRPLPDNVPVDYDDDDEPLPYLDPSFSYLERVYSLLQSLLSNEYLSDTTLSPFLSSSFISHLCSNFHSLDKREQSLVKTAIHRMYAKCVSKRPLIRSSLQQLFLDVIHCGSSTTGLDEVISFYNLILKGVSLPIHQDHIFYLNHCVLPLLKKPRIEGLFFVMNQCFKIVLGKDSSLGVPIVDALLKYWPIGNMNKEIAFLFFLQTVVINTNVDTLHDYADLILNRISRCCDCDHFIIVEKALQLWDDDRFGRQLQEMTDLGPLIRILKKNKESYWNKETKENFAKVLELYNTS